MVQQYDPLRYLPTDEDLPSSDETPVDNELQNLIPNLLLLILATIWDDRQDWFFGVDMGVYDIPTPPYVPIIPDGFLSLGVERRKRGDQGHLSYLLWRENNIPPILVLETVSENVQRRVRHQNGEVCPTGRAVLRDLQPQSPTPSPRTL